MCFQNSPMLKKWKRWLLYFDSHHKPNCKSGLDFNVVKAPYILYRRDNPLTNPLVSIILNIRLKSSLSLSFHLGDQREDLWRNEQNKSIFVIKYYYIICLKHFSFLKCQHNYMINTTLISPRNSDFNYRNLGNMSF